MVVMKKTKQIRSVVVDLDNTLLNRYGDISGNNSSILRQLNSDGVVVGLATGRRAEDVSDSLDFWKLGQAISFIIGSNGCDYLNLRTKNLKKSNYLTWKDLQKFADEFSGEGAAFAVRRKGRLYVSRMNVYVAAYCIANGFKPVIDSFETLERKKFSRILIIGSAKEIRKIFSSWNLKDFKAMPAGKHTIEVVHPEISKFEGLKNALEDFEIRPEEVMTFGDDYNDIELIRRTEGIAMKNAVEPLIEVARGITKYSGAQDGIAYHLNASLLGDEYIFGEPESEEYEEQIPLSEKHDNSDASQESSTGPAI